MLSKLLFNFAAVFFILYISATSATPAAQPASVELQKTNDDIHARARPPYSPYFCQYPYAWQRRECRTSIGPRAWQDVCTHSSYASRFQVEYDNIQGSCPPQTFCMDTVDGYNKRFIRCVRGTPGKRKREDPQTGWSQRKRARPTLANTQLEFSVKIENDMTGASVAAVIGSDDGDFLVAPNNVIVGKIQGKNIEVCKGVQSDPNKARECYPEGRYNFKKGDIINYTWGMTNDQEASLLYGIIPT